MQTRITGAFARQNDPALFGSDGIHRSRCPFCGNAAIQICGFRDGRFITNRDVYEEYRKSNIYNTVKDPPSEDMLHLFDRYEIEYRAMCPKCGVYNYGSSPSKAAEKWNRRYHPTVFVVSCSRRVARHMTVPEVMAVFESKGMADRYIEEYVEMYGDEPRIWYADELQVNSSYVSPERPVPF